MDRSITLDRYIYFAVKDPSGLSSRVDTGKSAFSHQISEAASVSANFVSPFSSFLIFPRSITHELVASDDMN